MAKKSAPKGVQFKRVLIDTKSLSESETDGEAEFDAYASVFGNSDSYGDVMHKGAFDRSLKAWAAKGSPIPLYFNHSVFGSDPTDNIGYLKIAKEDEKGLAVTPVLDVGANQKSAYVHRLLKTGRIRELSIGYIARTYDYSEVDGVEVRNLRDVDLLEVSVVPNAANDQATVVEVRSALQYGPDGDESDDGDDDADDDSSAAEAKAEVDAEALQALVDELTAAQEQFTAAFDALLTAATAALGTDDDDAEDDPSDDIDDPSQTAGEKSGKLSAQARRALALMALQSADKVGA